MNFNDFEQLVNNRQSCRSFSDKPIDTGLIEQIVKTALLSPSACNSQPWSFDIVNNSELSPKVAKATQGMGMNKFTDNCPAFIVVCQEKANLSEKVGMMFKDTDFVANDIGIACAHIVLGAQAAGLSTCILGWLSERELKKLLGHDKKTRVRLVIAIGYEGEKNALRQKKRKSFEETLRIHN